MPMPAFPRPNGRPHHPARRCAGMIEVIFDGVDTDRLAPNPPQRDLPNGPDPARGRRGLTFVNRNLEPYRGYHIFLRALPEVLAARPEAQVVIVGGDGSAMAPPQGGTWKDVILDEVKAASTSPASIFTGRVPYPTLVDLIQISRVHAYLTYPFVLSWSMVEAMAAGALVWDPTRHPVQRGDRGWRERPAGGFLRRAGLVRRPDRRAGPNPEAFAPCALRPAQMVRNAL
jgi:glycosyltransferase involved in cell wall biosynthesis